MNCYFSFRTLLLAGVFLITGNSLVAQYQMEYLTRGIHASRNAEGAVFVSWRLLGTESRDLAFNVYRTTNGKTSKLNAQPVIQQTSFTDANADSAKEHAYSIRPVINGKEQKSNDQYVLKKSTLPWHAIPLKTPPGYAAGDASVGDMDGDGVYEIIVHMNGRGKDNSQAGITDPPIFHCYKLDGTLLWEINLGKNIREGAHYTQFLVYDLDGDGKAEIAMKTADGTVDGKGTVIGDSTKDWRNDKGYILAGPEYLSVFDGQSGRVRSTTDFIPPRHPSSLTPTTEELKQIWGDGYGNRMDRFLGGIAYLDGKTPSLIMSRGYYTRTVIAAWNFRNGKIVPVWTFDSDDTAQPQNRPYRGQGNHNLSIADVDGDGKDEIVFGAMTIDDNGKGLYSTGLGHGDALHVSDLDPARPGMEVFDIQERFDDAGANFRDARTGEVIWKIASVKAGEDGEGPGRGLSLDIDPRYPGFESWVAGAGINGIFDVKGKKISEKSPPCNMGIFWDGDALSEILNGTQVSKWNYLSGTNEKLVDFRDFGCVHNNGSKSNPALSVDLWGDWREELIYRTTDSKELRIFSTTIPTDIKLYTLMHNPQYRLSIAWQNVAYNQPPHTSYFIGEGMELPPPPSIQIIKTGNAKK